MLSKPKMPTPYNTVVDADNGVTFGCMLTEGNVGRYEINVSNLFGESVANISNEQNNKAYWTANNKIVSSLTQGLSNFNDYKWSVRLFEQKGVIDTWCAYGTLQNVTGTDSPIVPPGENASADGKSITLRISAHQNIVLEEEPSSGSTGTFTVYGADYLKDGINYYPNPLAYHSDKSSASETYDLLYLPDTTKEVNTAASPKIGTIEITENGVERIGIFDNIVEHPTLAGHSIITVYDFSGNIIQCIHKGILDSSFVYESNGTKKSTEKRIYRYTLYKSNGDVWFKSIDKRYTLGRQCVGEYDATNKKFKVESSTDVSLDTSDECNNIYIISERDYQQIKAPKEIVRSYSLKIGGKTYKVTGYKMGEPKTDTNIDIYTYGNITISDSSEIDITGFKEGVSYTIYCNYIDSDEYYFKTHPNLFVSVSVNNSALNSETVTSLETMENTFYGYLTDINNNLYQNKIRSFQWSIYVKALNEVELIWKSGIKSSSQPILTYSNFIQGQEYLVTLEITTDDNFTYTSPQYPITVNNFVPINSNGEKLSLGIKEDIITASFNYQKHCVDLNIHENLRAQCEGSIAGALNQMQTVYKCTFERVDIYKTSNGTIYNKVASVPTELLNVYEGHVEDYIVGGGNKYTYYLYPVFKFEYTDTDKGIEYKALSPAVSNIVDVPIYGINVVGLIPQTDEYGNIIDNAYEIDYLNIWRFYLNAKNDTSTYNIAHTIHEGQKKYNKVSVGERGYITSGVTALLGDIKCSNDGRFDDGMEAIDNWEEFVNNGEMKIVCDQYGRIFPVDINECSYSYDENTPIRLCMFNFNYVQVADINEIEVLFNNDYIELTDYKLLANNLNHALSVDNDSNLTVGMAALAL